MLFNSYLFVFVFLPVACAGFLAFGRLAGHRAAIIWLILASFFFYGWWHPPFLLTLLGSIAVNSCIAIWLCAQAGTRPPRQRLTALMVGIAFDLGLLGYHKYSAFVLATVAGAQFKLTDVTLPLAISFYTLQQIAFLVDCYNKKVTAFDPLGYCLFVIFFPQLIAGPIVHHGEMMPQFQKRDLFRIVPERFVVGLSIFAIGLFKKVILADTLARYANPVFANADAHAPIVFAEAWVAALAFTFQLYFDFSGYSDMAIGLARLFGIKLPENFRSPYKAANLIDFWRRWHMTLSRFLRDLVYIPLGGNRHGAVRRLVNVGATMAIGGVWHGAGWTFILWGIYHGAGLVLNHLWRMAFGAPPQGHRRLAPVGSLVTFLFVAVGWVIFRAGTLDAAVAMLRAMAGRDGISLPASLAPYVQHWATAIGAEAYFRFEGMFPEVDMVLDSRFIDFRESLPMLALSFLIVWALPNVQQLFRQYAPVTGSSGGRGGAAPSRLCWQPGAAWGAAIGVAATFAVLGMAGESPFLYFQF